MAAYYEVPLTNAPEVFSIALNGVTYRISTWYRDVPEGGWFMDIAAADGTEIVNGIPLVTGVDLLGQYRYLGFTGQLWVATDGTPWELPTYDNLGTGSHLYLVVP